MWSGYKKLLEGFNSDRGIVEYIAAIYNGEDEDITTDSCILKQITNVFKAYNNSEEEFPFIQAYFLVDRDYFVEIEF